MIRYGDIRRMDDFQEVLLFCFVVLLLVGSEGGAEVNSTRRQVFSSLAQSEQILLLNHATFLSHISLFFVEIAHKSRSKLSVPLKNEGVTRSGYFPESTSSFVLLPSRNSLLSSSLLNSIQLHPIHLFKSVVVLSV